jgi:hypothetical protein
MPPSGGVSSLPTRAHRECTEDRVVWIDLSSLRYARIACRMISFIGWPRASERRRSRRYSPSGICAWTSVV